MVVVVAGGPSDSTDISAPAQPRVDVYEWRSTDGARWSGPTVTTDVPDPAQGQLDGVAPSESVKRAIDDLDLPGETLRVLPVGDDLLVPVVDASGHLLRVVAIDR